MGWGWNHDWGVEGDGDDDGGERAKRLWPEKFPATDGYRGVGGGYGETTYDECLRGKIYYISCLGESYTHSFLRKFDDERRRTTFARA